MEIVQVSVDKIEFKASEQTEEFKEQLSRLKDSIQSQGLFHPITVRPPANGTYPLASGEKRLLVYKELQLHEIPCVIRNVEEGEPEKLTHIHENLFRFNLPWYDQVELEKELHDLRIQQHGQGKQGKKTGWSLRDTAKELDMSFGVLSEDLRMAEVIIADPSLKKIGDKKTAKKIIFTMLKKMSQEAEAGMDVNPDELEVNKVYLGSSEEILKGFPQNVFHACITDPPWMQFHGEDQYTSDEFTLGVFKEVFRVLSHDSFLIIFVGTDDFILYRKELPKFGFQVSQMPNIWIKEGHLTRGKKTWEYERNYEMVLVAVKGSPALTNSMISAIFSCKIVPPMKMIHPNEKPKEIIKRYIDDCTYEGALILDPFAGSGVVCEVAQDMKRRWVAIERNPKHYTSIRKRMEKKDEKK